MFFRGGGYNLAAAISDARTVCVFLLTLRGVGFLTYGMVWGGGLKVPADKTRPLRSTEATTDATNHDKYCS